MKKLLISLELFITLCNIMINFPSPKHINSIQFWDTSSIIIGWELVFLNLGSKISENLPFFCLSRRILIVSFSISRLGFSPTLELSKLSSLTGLPVLA